MAARSMVNGFISLLVLSGLYSVSGQYCSTPQDNNNPISVSGDVPVIQETVGMPRTLYCCGDNQSDTTWYLNNDALTDDSDGKYEFDDSGQTLTINDFSWKSGAYTTEDEGVYMCVLENDLYSVNLTFTLCAFPTKKDDTNEPVFLESSSAVVHFTDDTTTVTLFCSVWAPPGTEVSVVWTRNNTLVPLHESDVDVSRIQTETMSTCDEEPEPDKELIYCLHDSACTSIVDLKDTIYSSITINITSTDDQNYTCSVGSDSSLSVSKQFQLLYSKGSITTEILELMLTIILPLILIVIVVVVACCVFRYEICLLYWKLFVKPKSRLPGLLNDIYLITSPSERIVNTMLQPWFNSWKYIVHYPERDDQIDQGRLVNMNSAIDGSLCMLIVLSNEFIRDSWATFASIDAITHTDIDNRAERKKIICVRLPGFQVPPKSTQLSVDDQDKHEKLKNLLKVYPVVDLPDKSCWMWHIKNKLLYRLPRLDRKGVYRRHPDRSDHYKNIEMRPESLEA